VAASKSSINGGSGIGISKKKKKKNGAAASEEMKNQRVWRWHQ